MKTSFSIFLLPFTGFFSVAYLTSFLLFVPVYFSSVSDSCSYPSCHLCLPLLHPFMLSIIILAAKGATS